MFSIFKKEIRSFFGSLIAYLVIAVFLLGISLFMWVFPNSNVLDYGYADMDTLFSMSPYIFLFLIPAITMRSFAEERKTGTIELLFTRPLQVYEIVLGKYLACFCLVLFALLPTLLYYYSVYQLGNPVGNVDTAGMVGSYFGLVLLGAVFTAIGVCASAFTKDQIISFILAFFLCFVFYQGFSSLASADDAGGFSYWVMQLGIDYHYNTIRKGLIDSRDLIYFLSIITIMLAITGWKIKGGNR